MSELTLEPLARRIEALRTAMAAGVPNRSPKDWHKVVGMFLDVNALESYCKEHLSKQKRPRLIQVLRDLPKNFLGKVLRRKLREPVPAS